MLLKHLQPLHSHIVEEGIDLTNVTRMQKMWILVMVCAMMLTLTAGCGTSTTDTKTDSKTADADKDYVIQLGYYNCDHMVAACVGKDAGIYDELGLKVNVTGNGSVPEAMAAGKMDAGYIGTDGLMFAHMQGSPIFMAANNHTSGSYYLVASNSIQSAADLVGKKLAIGTDAEKNDPNWVWMATKLGIPVDSKQYQNYDMDLQTKYSTMVSGQLDGYICCDPWGSMAEYEKTGHILISNVDNITDKCGVCCCFALRQGFVKDHPELAKKLVLAHTRSIEYIYLHPVKAAKIFADNYKVPLEVAMMTIYKKTGGEGRTLTWVVDKTEINNYFTKASSLEGYKETESPDKWVDTSILDSCGADKFDEFIKAKVDPVFPVGMSYEDWKTKAQEVDEKI